MTVRRRGFAPNQTTVFEREPWSHTKRAVGDESGPRRQTPPHRQSHPARELEALLVVARSLGFAAEIAGFGQAVTIAGEELCVRVKR